jgi:hypothetical protein
MRGSIRAIGGLIVVMAAVGGIENATDGQLLPCIAVAVLGLLCMYSGTNAMQDAK